MVQVSLVEENPLHAGNPVMVQVSLVEVNPLHAGNPEMVQVSLVEVNPLHAGNPVMAQVSLVEDHLSDRMYSILLRQCRVILNEPLSSSIFHFHKLIKPTTSKYC
jgi:hypothetical protein